MIYLDNAATTLHKPACVAQAVVQAMGSFGNSARGAHDGSLCASRTIYRTREKLAELFGLDAPERVVFTANATEALNIALGGLFASGDHVISTDLEHNSVLRPLYRLQEQGIEVDFAAADAMGNVSCEDFARLIRSNTRAIVCTHASNLTGNVTDISEIGRIAHENGLLFVVDASQSAGVLPIDMQRMHIDVLCFTGHKSLMGPQGTGGLCIADGVCIRPWKVGGTGVSTYLEHQPQEYPTRLEAGTLNGHGIAGLSAALDFIRQTGVGTVYEHEQRLMRRFYEAVCATDGVTVYGDFSAPVRAPVVSLNICGMDSGEVSDILMQEYDIATRSGAHCAPRLHRALGTQQTGAVRFSFGWFNTDAEADAAAAAVREIAQG